MDYNNLIKQLRETPSRSKRELMDKAADAIEQLSQSWISVEDRLPDSFKPVIVCREKAKGEFIVDQGHRDVNGWWKVYGTRTKNVSYWMPMPEPPKERIDEIILKQDEMLKRRDALKGKKEG